MTIDELSSSFSLCKHKQPFRMAANSKSKPSSAKNKLYETEQALGPLPAGWEKGTTKDGRVYFVEYFEP
jgi:hypothetical protein